MSAACRVVNRGRLPAVSESCRRAARSARSDSSVIRDAARAAGRRVGGSPPYGWRSERGQLVPVAGEQWRRALVLHLARQGWSSPADRRPAGRARDQPAHRPRVRRSPPSRDRSRRASRRRGAEVADACPRTAKGRRVNAGPRDSLINPPPGLCSQGIGFRPTYPRRHPARTPPRSSPDDPRSSLPERSRCPLCAALVMDDPDAHRAPRHLARADAAPSDRSGGGYRNADGLRAGFATMRSRQRPPGPERRRSDAEVPPDRADDAPPAPAGAGARAPGPRAPPGARGPEMERDDLD